MREPGRHVLANGATVRDSGSSLRFGRRGPLMLEDRLLQEVTLGFAHSAERPRVVHAGGIALSGWFECLQPLTRVSAIHAFGAVGRRSPAVVRLSRMSGAAGTPDPLRDVRGMAVRLATDDGDLDLLCQSIPVSFVQDPLLYPKLVIARRAPTNTTFWELVVAWPEMLHAVLHLMSSRGLPASLAEMDVHAVHTFRLVSADGAWTYAKFHWLAVDGTRALDAIDAERLAGAAPTHHACELLARVSSDVAPAWDLVVQLFDEDTAARQPYDVLDPTKLLPEEEVPYELVGRLVLDDVVGDAATDELAFSAAHLVPGIEASEDPVLQGRLAAYLPAHLVRVGPSALRSRPTQTTARHVRPAHVVGVADHVERVRERPSLFADHHGQARQFWNAQPAHERAHIVNAIAGELARCPSSVAAAVLGHLGAISVELTRPIAQLLRIQPDDVPDVDVDRAPTTPCPSLSVTARRHDGIQPVVPR